jgi:uncharacterized protein YaaW (UPF0174 family)
MEKIEAVLNKADFEELAELAKYLKVEGADIYEIRRKFKDNTGGLASEIIKALQFSAKSIVDKVFEYGKSISYYQILTKILDRLEVYHSEKATVKELEEKVLNYFLENIDKLSQEEREKIILSLKNKDMDKILDKVNLGNSAFLLAGDIGPFLFLISKLVEQIGENYSRLIPAVILIIRLRLKYPD